MLGFNSAEYDLNLVKPYLIPWLSADVDPDKEGEKEDIDINVIKKGSMFTQIGALRFKQLPGWWSTLFSCPWSLQNSRKQILISLWMVWSSFQARLSLLAPYESCYLELKRRNVLEIRDKNNDDHDENDVIDKEIGAYRCHYRLRD